MTNITQIPVEMSTEGVYDIDRKQASDLLACSMRSIDRYIKREWLHARKVNGNVWLNKEEVLHLRDESFPQRKWPGITAMRHENSLPETPIAESSVVTPEEVSVETKSHRAVVTKEHFALYEKLLEKLRIDGKDRESRLAEAHYKIGQLEEKLVNALPVTEIQNKEAVLRAKEEEITKKLHAEKLNKYVYLSLLFGILLLQPLFWYLLKLNI